MRARSAWKAGLVGLMATCLVALAGGLAFASAAPGHIPKHIGSPATITLHAVESAGDTFGLAATSTQTSGPHDAGSNAAGTRAGATVPSVLLLASPQASAQLSLGGTPAADHSATGGGSTSLMSFGFTAQSHQDGKVGGTVSGNAEFVFPAPFSGHIHVEVNCLQVVGNQAFVSGVMTNSAFGLSKGSEILFGVQDGDGAAKADLISNVFFSSAPLTCLTFHPTPFFAIQGNTEIH